LSSAVPSIGPPCPTEDDGFPVHGCSWRSAGLFSVVQWFASDFSPCRKILNFIKRAHFHEHQLNLFLLLKFELDLYRE
jgi:hypothetical protein